MPNTAALSTKTKAEGKEARAGGCAKQQGKYRTTPSVQHLKDRPKTPCGICMDEIKAPSQQILLCGHTFCRACLDYWTLVGQENCPLCREPIWLDENYNLILRTLDKSSFDLS
jgi:hypothetical protein